MKRGQPPEITGRISILIAIVEHFVFGDQIITSDHQMRLDREIQLAQEFFGALGAFDLDGSGWMAQLDLHERMIRLASAGLQQSIQLSAISADPESCWSETRWSPALRLYIAASRRNFADSSGATGLM